MSRSNHRNRKYPRLHDSRNFDPSCRSNGGCPWCRSGRLHVHERRAKPWRADEPESILEWNDDVAPDCVIEDGWCKTCGCWASTEARIWAEYKNGRRT